MINANRKTKLDNLKEIIVQFMKKVKHYFNCGMRIGECGP